MARIFALCYAITDVDTAAETWQQVLACPSLSLADVKYLTGVGKLHKQWWKCYRLAFCGSMATQSYTEALNFADKAAVEVLRQPVNVTIPTLLQSDRDKIRERHSEIIIEGEKVFLDNPENIVKGVEKQCSCCYNKAHW